jgi:hypothetical protein
MFQQPIMIFLKTFFPLNLRADNTKLRKQIEKKLDTSEVMAEKQFFTPLGKWRHLEPK